MNKTLTKAAITLTAVVALAAPVGAECCTPRPCDIYHDARQRVETTVNKALSSVDHAVNKTVGVLRTVKREEPKGKNLGTFRLTFYVPDAQWGYQTATGVRSEHLKTCAVDPAVIPYGSVLQITGDNGQTLTLRAVDCGSAVKGNKIDIVWSGTESAGRKWMAEFGIHQEVTLIEGGEEK